MDKDQSEPHRLTDPDQDLRTEGTHHHPHVTSITVANCSAPWNQGHGNPTAPSTNPPDLKLARDIAVPYMHHSRGHRAKRNVDPPLCQGIFLLCRCRHARAPVCRLNGNQSRDDRIESVIR